MGTIKAMRVHCTFISLLLLSPCIAHAACSALDYRGKRLGPVRDQGASQWCFAYSAADLISYESGQQVSASGIALNYLAGGVNIFDKVFHGRGDDGKGFASEAIESSRKTGACLEEHLKSDPQAFREYIILRGKDFKLDPLAQKYWDICHKPTCREGFQSSLFPIENFCDVWEIVSGGKLTSNESLAKRADLLCGPKVKFASAPPTYQISNIANPNFRKWFDTALESGRPVEIGYSDYIWSADQGATHSSLVVARRSVGARCKYLVRGSYGPTCKGVDARFECEKLDPGNVWVDGDQLFKYVDEATYF